MNTYVRYIFVLAFYFYLKWLIGHFEDDHRLSTRMSLSFTLFVCSAFVVGIGVLLLRRDPLTMYFITVAAALSAIALMVGFLLSRNAFYTSMLICSAFIGAYLASVDWLTIAGLRMHKQVALVSENSSNEAEPTDEDYRAELSEAHQVIQPDYE